MLNTEMSTIIGIPRIMGIKGTSDPKVAYTAPVAFLVYCCKGYVCAFYKQLGILFSYFISKFPEYFML